MYDQRESIDRDSLSELKVASDPKLDPEEKETTVTAPNDTDHCTIFSEVPVFIKWVLSIEESRITDHRIHIDHDEEAVYLTAITAEIPKGIIKFKGSARKSDTNGDMVSYGALR